ncbi:MAG TPA: fibronectin type III-like domain-contianing protein, partial [Sphingomicrobium sp.]|nr:fibronectin type III-like domain-contianing protein [Sphingomicrobium sp.]
PIRALRGFRRVHLLPGESQEIAFDLSPRDLSMVAENGDIVIPSGTYGVSIGGGQPGSGLPAASAKFDVSGSIALPE